MLSLEEYLLVCLSEECSELQQAVSKSLRFGLDSYHPDNPKRTNRKDLITEFTHIIAVSQMMLLIDLDLSTDEHEYEEKVKKLSQYEEVSRRLGRLESD